MVHSDGFDSHRRIKKKWITKMQDIIGYKHVVDVFGMQTGVIPIYGEVKPIAPSVKTTKKVKKDGIDSVDNKKST